MHPTGLVKPDDPDAKVDLLGSDDYHLGEGSGNDLILHRNMVHIVSMENGMYQIKKEFSVSFYQKRTSFHWWPR